MLRDRLSRRPLSLFRLAVSPNLPRTGSRYHHSFDAFERTVFVHALAKMRGGNARETTLRRCCRLPLPRGVKEPVDVGLVVVGVT